VDGEAGVDAFAAEEVAADVEAGAFRGNEDDVDVFRRNDLGKVVVDDGEAVRKVEGVAFVEVALDLRPADFLRGVGKQVLDDRALLDGFFDLEEGSISKRVSPGTKPSRLARFQSFMNFLDWPIITLKPLSRRLSAWAGPCTP